MKHKAQFIVAHPCNPPYHTPMVELVPAPWTSQEVRDGARRLMQEVGQGPVSLSREVPGFVLNRMQYSILNECWRLIRDGVVSPQDLDVVMKDGMGMRYAFMGPMETIHLNAEGTQNYCDRYGDTIYNVSSDLGPIPTGWKYVNTSNFFLTHESKTSGIFIDRQRRWIKQKSKHSMKQ